MRSIRRSVCLSMMAGLALLFSGCASFTQKLDAFYSGIVGGSSERPCIRLELTDAGSGAPLSGQAYVGKALPSFGTEFAKFEVEPHGVSKIPHSGKEHLVVHVSGYVPVRVAPEVVLESLENGGVCAIDMRRGGSITGVVRDDEGMPIDGIEVVISSPIRTRLHGEDVLVYPGYDAARAAMAYKELVETDSEGRYYARGLEFERVKEVRISLVGEDLPATRRVTLKPDLAVDLVAPK